MNMNMILILLSPKSLTGMYNIAKRIFIYLSLLTLCDLNLDLTRVSQHFTNSMAPSLAYPGPTESRDIKLPSSTNPRQFD